jgi:D-arabinose 1-dehydrogenase-like Zn-dependent alcohol dehydrogenase
MESFDIVDWGKPLQSVVRETPVPTGEQVRVRVTACGVCHSDLHIKTGALDLGQGRSVSFESVGVRLPFTMGHEIVGVVDAVGPDSTAVPGTPCVVYPWAGCGHCRHCLRDHELSCDAGQALGTRRPGGYADYVIVAHQRYLLDYGMLDPQLAATCACSGLTAYSAWNKCPALSEDDTVLIIGAGGLGLAALGLAEAVTKARLVIGDIHSDKLALAERLGATILDMAEHDAAATLKKMVGEGVRAVIDFVGTPSTVEFAMKVAGRGAIIVVVGLFGGATSLSTALLPMKNLTLRGSYVGSLAEMKALLELVKRGVSLNVPLDIRPMAEINQALDDLAAGRVSGRIVAQVSPGVFGAAT